MFRLSDGTSDGRSVLQPCRWQLGFSKKGGHIKWEYCIDTNKNRMLEKPPHQSQAAYSEFAMTSFDPSIHVNKPQHFPSFITVNCFWLTVPKIKEKGWVFSSLLTSATHFRITLVTVPTCRLEPLEITPWNASCPHYRSLQFLCCLISVFFPLHFSFISCHILTAFQLQSFIGMVFHVSFIVKCLERRFAVFTQGLARTQDPYNPQGNLYVILASKQKPKPKNPDQNLATK